MTTAPPLNCAECGQRIGKTRSHYLLGYPEPSSADRLLCGPCMLGGKRLHAKYYPDCPAAWHDLFDHGGASATRTAAARTLGLWPAR